MKQRHRGIWRWGGWSLLLLALVLGDWGATQAQGNRLREGMRGHIELEEAVIDHLVLPQSGGENHVLKQENAGGEVTSGTMTSTDLGDSGTLARVTGPQRLTDTGTTPRSATLSGAGGTYVLDPATVDLYVVDDLAASATFEVTPSAALEDGQILTLRIKTAASETLAWEATDFADGTAGFGYTAPSATTGSNVTDLLAWRYHAGLGKFQFLTSTQAQASLGVVHLSALSAQFPANTVQFPVFAPALLDLSTVYARLRFDDTNGECVYWEFMTPEDYQSTPTFMFVYSMLSTAVGNAAWDIRLLVDDGSTALSTQTPGTANACDDAAVPSTLGATHLLTCPLTNTDGLVANSLTQLTLCRVPSRDNATDDAAYHRGVLTYVK